MFISSNGGTIYSIAKDKKTIVKIFTRGSDRSVKKSYTIPLELKIMRIQCACDDKLIVWCENTSRRGFIVFTDLEKSSEILYSYPKGVRV